MSRSMQAMDWDAVPVKTGVITNPAAGVDGTVTVPTGKRWLFLGATGTYATDATVSNRYPRLNVADDGTNMSRSYVATSAVAASNSIVVTFAAGAYTTGIGNVYDIIGIGNLEVKAGAVLTFTAYAKQAGDDWSAIYYAYKEAPG